MECTLQAKTTHCTQLLSYKFRPIGRLHADIVLCLQIVHDLIDLKLTDLGFKVLDPWCRTRGHDFKLCQPRLQNIGKKICVRTYPGFCPGICLTKFYG